MKKSLKEMAFAEVFHNPPKVAQATGRKKGKTAMRKQMIAIALNKARKGKL